MPLPKFEDWRRPWKDGELDEEAAAKLVWNARKSEEDAKAKVHEKDDEIAQLKTDLDDAKAAKSGTDAESQEELKTLRKENRELKDAAGKPDAATQRQIDQLVVGLKLGLSLADSKRLVGDTLEDIEADAKTFAEEHGIELPGNDEGNDSDKRQPPQRNPKLDRQGRLNSGFQSVDQGSGITDPAEIMKTLPPLR